jgi:hypothetical protein
VVGVRSDVVMRKVNQKRQIKRGGNARHGDGKKHGATKYLIFILDVCTVCPPYP